LRPQAARKVSYAASSPQNCFGGNILDLRAACSLQAARKGKNQKSFLRAACGRMQLAKNLKARESFLNLIITSSFNSVCCELYGVTIFSPSLSVKFNVSFEIIIVTLKSIYFVPILC
jgi:hypothetical protein